MKMNRRILTLFTVALLASLPALSRAQDDTPDTTTAGSDTNAPPTTLKELMAVNNQVTNTVGIALIKNPSAQAVGFTGSRIAGRALFDAAAARPDR